MQKKQLILFLAVSFVCLAAVALVLSTTSPEEREKMRQARTTAAAVLPEPEAEPVPEPEPEPIQEAADAVAVEVEDEAEEEKQYVYVEQMPQFPGGEKALMEFVQANIRYPQDAAASNAEGVVYVQFLVTKKGAVKNIKVIKGLHPSLDREAERVVKSMPVWVPGKQNGREVSVLFTLPIRFSLKDAASAAKEEEPVLFVYADEQPKFPGGDNELFLYLKLHQQYPPDAREKKIEGVVDVEFVVSKTGRVQDARIKKSLHPSLDAEALRLVNAMPQWKPGKQNNRIVPVKYTLPVRFALDKNTF